MTPNISQRKDNQTMKYAERITYSKIMLNIRQGN